MSKSKSETKIAKLKAEWDALMEKMSVELEHFDRMRRLFRKAQSHIQMQIAALVPLIKAQEKQLNIVSTAEEHTRIEKEFQNLTQHLVDLETANTDIIRMSPELPKIIKEIQEKITRTSAIEKRLTELKTLLAVGTEQSDKEYLNLEEILENNQQRLEKDKEEWEEYQPNVTNFRKREIRPLYNQATQAIEASQILIASEALSHPENNGNAVDNSQKARGSSESK